ncbi:hypothetical protein PFISCL1PPCAC_13033, partial [Pristionchus fissidentatus]
HRPSLLFDGPHQRTVTSRLRRQRSTRMHARHGVRCVRCGYSVRQQGRQWIRMLPSARDHHDDDCCSNDDKKVMFHLSAQSPHWRL